MTHYRCIYRGPDRNEARFGLVTNGRELILTKHEYKSVAEDDDFEFVEEIPLIEDLPETEPEPVVETPVVESVEEVDEVEEEYDVEDEDEDVPPYSEWKKAELVEEIEARNEGREDDLHLAVSGTKAELVERLEADDE